MTAIVDVLAMLVILLLASPAHADVSAAAARDAVIVVGSHGRPEPTGLLVGSVAEGVDRVAGCTVIVVKQPSEPHAQSRLSIATRSG